MSSSQSDGPGGPGLKVTVRRVTVALTSDKLQASGRTAVRSPVPQEHDLPWESKALRTRMRMARARADAIWAAQT